MTNNEKQSWRSPEAQTSKPNTSRSGTSRKQAVNQTLSCAECRRLKLRCDRVFPCGSCQKRGIAELCPEGSLPTRSKPVASSTDKEQLYQRLSELRGRVLELENALETAHAQVSSNPHPLLSAESFARKSQSKRRKATNGQVDEDDHDEDADGEQLDEAIGSLNMSGEGQARFFGRSACVERLFKYQDSSILSRPTEGNILVSAEVAMIYQSFPFLTVGEATNLVQERIWRHLPPLQRAESLRQCYCRHMHHITDVVPQDDWFDDLFTRIYKDAQSLDTPPAAFSEAGVRADELALIFAYFALGALMDLNLTPFNYEAEAYAYLSRSALTSMNVLQNATITTIETLILLAYFEEMWGEMIGSGDAWIITALAISLAQTMGLQRNTRKFGLDPAEVKRREKVYWELYTLELIESLAHGRPSVFSSILSDVDMPPCSDSNTEPHAFRYRLAVECLAPLCKVAFGLKMPNYNSVIELDRKIRKLCGDFGIGVAGKNITFSGMNESEAIDAYRTLVYRESTLLYLHRSFFARAVVMNPSDPQHTKYGLSVSGAYDSAMTLIQALGDVFQYHPASSARALLCWSHTLCSVFILGSVVTRCPGSRLAPLAVKRLHDIDDLYRRASIYGGRASADAPIVSRMKEKSDVAIQQYSMEHNRPSRGFGKGVMNYVEPVGKRDPEDEDDDELGLLGGYTRVIKPVKSSASPESSTCIMQPGFSPGQGNVSPGTTETASLSAESVQIHTDQFSQWGADGTSMEYQYRAEDHRSSPSGNATDLVVSSGGFVNSRVSSTPPSTIPIQHQSYISNESSTKPFEPHQGGVEMQYSGAPIYPYANNLPAQPPVILRYDSDIQIAMHPQNQQHVDYIPMDVAAEVSDWNFLDDWYGHVFQLDVIPPEYPRKNHTTGV